MKKIPSSEDALVLRTDFSNESAWASICAAITQPVGEFRAYVDFVSDPEYDGLIPDQLARLMPEDGYLAFAFIIDQVALTHPEHPILVVDLCDEPGRTFRVIPSQICSVENNLSIANMDFEEFAEEVGDDGIFRGFPEE
jgi:hypothetical protein